MTTEEFFREYRKLPKYQQQTLLSLVDSYATYTPGIDPKLIQFLGSNPHINWRYLSKSLVGMSA